MRLISRQVDAKRYLLPAGWEWKREPKLIEGEWAWGTLQFTSETTAAAVEAYKSLVQMVLDNAVELHFISAGTPKRPVPNPINVRPHHKTGLTQEGYHSFLKRATSSQLNLFGWKMSDGTEIPPGGIMHKGVPLACKSCRRVFPNLVTNPNDPKDHRCPRCVRVCPGSGASECNIPIFDEFQGCEKHFPRTNCTHCHKQVEVARTIEFDQALYCYACGASICRRCKAVGSISPDEEAVHDGRETYLVCRKCRPWLRFWLNQPSQEELILEKPCNMRLLSHSDRPVRLASVELEVDSGAQEILQELYSKGLAATNQIVQHWQGDSSAGFCYMERDSSLSEGGGELIFSKIRLNDPTTAEKLAAALGIVRKHVKAGKAEINLKTGAHIHIDAHKLGFNHIRNAVILHNFLEDPLYRLAAANYSRHRGVFFAAVLPKKGLETQAAFNSAFFAQNEHHSVFNVAYFYRTVSSNCVCGNIVAGKPELCGCNLGKCTAEFRVFNGTSSWKKLHAYLALSMSLMAFAHKAEYLDVNDFPPCLYNPVSMTDDTLRQEWMTRLMWMFENLWFSPDERASIHYCLEHSELSDLSYAEKKKLRGLEYQGFRYSATPTEELAAVNPFSRGRKNARTFVEAYAQPYISPRLPEWGILSRGAYAPADNLPAAGYIGSADEGPDEPF